MAQRKPQLPESLSAIRGYGLAIVSVSAAIGLGLLMQRLHFEGVEIPFFLFAAAVTAWYGGGKAAALAFVLSCLSFDFFFVPPIHSFTMARIDIPYFAAFAAISLLVSWFAAVRHRVEQELLQSQAELKTEVAERTQQASLLNLTHDSIFVRDTNDVITYWNRGSQELYGWTSEQAIGKRSPQLLRTEFPRPIEEIRAELVSSGRWDGEVTRTRSDGTQLVVASRWSLQRDEHDRPTAILETNNDITERKRREEEIRTLNRELGKQTLDLEATNKELEAFAYSVSHDLRAPLRHMVGFTELLQKSAASVLNEKSQRYVGILLESAKRMGNLIDDLLAFSRIGRAEAHKKSISLEEIVQEALSEVRHETEGRNIVWKVDPLPQWHGDASMLRLALVNLMSNAAKFTRTRPEAQIEIGCMDRQPGQIVLFIRDNGVGFNMKYANKLFGVFQRLHPPEEFEGTGIGLATVQRIVHRHGGRVWAEGVVDQGATFYFSLSKAKELDP